MAKSQSLDRDKLLLSVDDLLQWIDEAYEKQAWHGPNLRSALRGVTSEQAIFRPDEGRKNIAEIALHCAYWKYVTWRRLTGERTGSFPHAGTNWFDRETASETEWKGDKRLLGEMHRRLREAICKLPMASLRQSAAGNRRTNWDLIRGIANHDIYHAGQIQTIRRLAAE